MRRAIRGLVLVSDGLGPNLLTAIDLIGIFRRRSSGGDPREEILGRRSSGGDPREEILGRRSSGGDPREKVFIIQCF